MIVISFDDFNHEFYKAFQRMLFTDQISVQIDFSEKMATIFQFLRHFDSHIRLVMGQLVKYIHFIYRQYLCKTESPI